MNISSSRPSRPKVSICLLSYNHGHVIGGVIESILAQSYPDYELIISDDCSEDNSFEVISGYAKKYSQIRAIKTPLNLGMGGNMNFSSHLASGQYLAFLHHDDLVSPKLIEKWVEVAEKSDNIAFVFNDYLCNGEPAHAKENRGFSQIMDGKVFLKKYLLNAWGCPVRGTALVKKSYFIQVGGADLRFNLLSDVDLWMKLASKWDVGYVNEPLIVPRHVRPENYPKEYTEFTWTRVKMLFDIHANNIKRENFRGYFFYNFYRLKLRIKVSAEILKWFLYAIVRGRKGMVFTSLESDNEYEFYFVKIFKRIVLMLYGN